MAAFHETLFEIGGTPVSLFTLAVTVAIIIASWMFSAIARALVRRGLRARGIPDNDSTGALLTVVHYAIVIGGLFVAVQTAGVRVSALLAGAAALAVGAGFGLQNTVQNLVSGLVLILERSVRRGDVLEVEGRMVRVVNIRLRSTVAVTRDGEYLIFPNASLVQATIKNLTLNRDEAYRMRIVVGVSYSSDLGKVRQTLEQVAESLSWSDKTRQPRVYLKDFGSSSVDYEVAVWTKTPWESQQQQSDVREAIWAAFKSHDIVIAFPQLDLHLDPPVQAGLSRASAS